MKKRIFSVIRTCALIGALSVSFTPSLVMAQGIEGDTITELENVNVINEGRVKALVVRLGFKDYPLDETNVFYRDDAYFYDIFNCEPGSDIRAGEPYDNAENFILRSSFGKQSLSLEKVVDIQLDHEQSYYYPVENTEYSSFEEIRNFIESDEFSNKLSDAVDLSEYDSNNDGYTDALYVFDMSPDNGVENDFLAFYDGKGQSRSNPKILYTYIPGEAWAYHESKYNIKETVIHETGHMLWGLKDLYGVQGFIYFTSANTIGNLMGFSNNGAGDVDGYSKYLIGWIGEENVIRLSKAEIMETSREIHLQPSDGDAVQGKMLAVIDCGDGYKIAAEYVSGSNNNRSPLLDENPYGFRFYKLYDDEIVELYDNGEKSVFSDGDEISPFGEDIFISDIKTGKDPSLMISYDMDSVSKGLIKRTASEYTFDMEEGCIYSDLFAYDDKRAAFIQVDENENGILYLYENGSVTKLRDIDLSGTGGRNDNAFIHARKTNDGNILLYGNNFIVKMDKDGNLLSPIINPPNGINYKTVLVGNRLICTYTHPLFLGEIYFDINLDDMSIQENNSAYHAICDIGQDKYLAPNPDSEDYIVLDGKDNPIAFLEKGGGSPTDFRVTETENGYLSVERKYNNGVYVYEVTRYDKSGNIVSSDYLKEASIEGSGLNNKLFTDDSFHLDYGEIINTATGFLVTFSDGVIIVDGDTLEAEYVGKNTKKYEEYYAGFKPVYLNNGTIIASSMDEHKTKSGIIVELGLPSNNETGQEEKEADDPEKGSVENTGDDSADESDGNNDKEGAEGNNLTEDIKSDKKTDNADGKESSGDSEGTDKGGDNRSEENNSREDGKREIASTSKKLSDSVTGAADKTKVIPVSSVKTGDENNMPVYYIAAGASAVTLSAVLIKRRRSVEK